MGKSLPGSSGLMLSNGSTNVIGIVPSPVSGMIVTSPAIGFWIALLQPARGVFSMISVVPGGAVTVPPPGKVAVQSEFGQLSGDVFVIANWIAGDR